MAELLDEDVAARRAAAVVAALAARGVHAGDRVAVLAGNGAAFVAARDAATLADLVLVPINPRLARDEIAWILAHARPRVLLVDSAHEGAAPASVPHLALDGIAPGRAVAPLDPARIGATLLYTSGTTGRPKGCWRTAAEEAARTDELRASYALSAQDTHLIVCPLGHSAPGIFLRAARAAGARTVIAARFTAERLVDDVQQHQASVVFLVPTQVHRLLAIDPRPRLDSLRAVIVAGAPFSPAQKAAFAAWLGPRRLYEFYGSSETGTVSVIGPDEHAAHPGSVGRPPAGTSVRVIDGEIYVRSPAVMSGYLTEDGATVAPLAQRDGHVSVGDLGTIDATGWVTLVDRKHDTIIPAGSMSTRPRSSARSRRCPASPAPSCSGFPTTTGASSSPPWSPCAKVPCSTPSRCARSYAIGSRATSSRGRSRAARSSSCRSARRASRCGARRASGLRRSSRGSIERVGRPRLATCDWQRARRATSRSGRVRGGVTIRIMNTGGCLCGAVRYEVDQSLTSVTYCHCSRCRRWHGHVGAYTAVDHAGFRITESRGLRWYDSSPRVKRGFCGECGSSVLFDEAMSPKMGISAGTLDAPTGIHEKAHIYTASKGDYYEIASGLIEYEVFPGKS